ncbi:MAG: hypothetical protein PHW25_14605 [Zoogloea sp.]|uniref:hypothetical protein n=1 Tax=Zoogloea sp. TaxID=49181 RepID=UPI0026291395|nr:hypothetical protein [Zoogloea sp.]MDD3328310.1 hypothetical protein [Zoogloea sp.]
MNTAQLPAAIEIFRPGVLIDDAGVERTFTAADIRAMAEGYDPALREAPLCVGHPESNLPAYGWVARLAVNDAGRLVMDPHQVEPQFAEMVSGGRFKKRSAAFYPPQHPSNPKPGTWYLRHVAFLGAQPPAVDGLKDIQFSESEASDGFVCFSEAGGSGKPTQELSMDEKERLAKAEAEAAAALEAKAQAEKETAEAKAQLAKFAEQQRADRHAGFVQFAEGALAAGKLKRPDAAALPAVLSALADAAPVEFAEAGATKKVTPVEWLKNFIVTGTPVVQFGEFAPAGGLDADVGSAKGKTDAEIDAAAKAYAAKNKVQYAEALKAVVGFTA